MYQGCGRRQKKDRKEEEKKEEDKEMKKQEGTEKRNAETEPQKISPKKKDNRANVVAVGTDEEEALRHVSVHSKRIKPVESLNKKLKN